MNDAPDSTALEPLASQATSHLVNGLQDAVPDRPAPKENPPAPDRPWSDRFKASGKPADYQLLDQIWLSPALASGLDSAGIGRRTHLRGDGSDHDPVWVNLDL